MTTQWPTQKLGDLCDLVGGGTPAKDRKDFYGGTIPWATVRDMNVEVLTSTEHSLTEAGLEASSSHVVPAGSVVIATRVGLGKVVILAQDTAINQDLRGLVIRNHNMVTDRFLYWWYRSATSKVISAGTGATVQGVTLPFVSSLELPVPPLAEQQRIVAKLEMLLPEVEHGLSLVSQTKSKSDDLVLSSLSEVFERLVSSPFRFYSDVAELSLGKMLDRKKATGKNLTPYLRNVNVRWGAFDTSDVMEMDITPSELDRVSVRQGDVVVCEGGEPGRCAVWREERSMAIQKALHRMRPKPGIDSDYLALNLEYQIKCGTAKHLFTGTTIKHLTGEKLQVMTLPVPPLHEQQEVVAQLNAVRQGADALRSVADERRRTLLAMRQSVLALAFRGDL